MTYLGVVLLSLEVVSNLLKYLSAVLVRVVPHVDVFVNLGILDKLIAQNRQILLQ